MTKASQYTGKILCDIPEGDLPRLWCRMGKTWMKGFAVWCYEFYHPGVKVPGGTHHVHHLDKCAWNNTKDNLVMMTTEDHKWVHSSRKEEEYEERMKQWLLKEGICSNIFG
jgi:hypothetical protein